MKQLAAVCLLAVTLGCGAETLSPEQIDALREQAEQGVAEVQYNLGTAHDIGRGVPQDDAEAVRWYRLAAEAEGGFV